jgi:hypothetical protein
LRDTNKGDHFGRDLLAAMAVNAALEKFRHLKPYGRSARKKSACALVANVLGMGEEAVRKATARRPSGRSNPSHRR